LTITPPTFDVSTNAEASRPAARVPDAARTGVVSSIPPRVVFISGSAGVLEETVLTDIV
jgi:hypothetical protein